MIFLFFIFLFSFWTKKKISFFLAHVWPSCRSVLAFGNHQMWPRSHQHSWQLAQVDLGSHWVTGTHLGYILHIWTSRCFATLALKNIKMCSYPVVLVRALLASPTKSQSGSRVQLDEISGSRSAGEAKTRAKAFLDVEHRSCFLSCKREEPLSGRGFHITSLSVIVALWLRVIFKTEADCISQKALLGVFIEFLMAVLWICKKLWFHDPGGFWVLQYLETFSNRQHSDSFLLHFPSFSFTLFFFLKLSLIVCLF